MPAGQVRWKSTTPDEREPVVGYVNENVNLRSMGRFRLDQGRMILYRASRDIHQQYSPESFSVSLNLISVDFEKAAKINQYYFDVKNSTVAGIVNRSSAEFITSIAAHFGNDNTEDLLNDLLSLKYCHRTRAAAYVALFKRRPDRLCELIEQSRRDPSPFVSKTVHNQLDSMPKLENA